MRITEKQLMMLVQTLKDTLIFVERKSDDPFCFNHPLRHQLFETILNQQSNLIIDVRDNG